VMLLATGYSFGDFGLVDGWMYKLDAKKAKDWFTWSDSVPASDDDFVQAVFASALERAPQPQELESFHATLQKHGRREAALDVFSSYERLRNTARTHGFL